MKSRTLIDKQAERKLNPEVVETIIKAKKLKGWLEIAGLMSYPRRMRISLNLYQIDKETKEGDTVIIPGKVLGTGEMGKRIRIAALSFSEDAKKKLKASKCEAVSIDDEIKINPQAKGLKILR